MRQILLRLPRGDCFESVAREEAGGKNEIGDAGEGGEIII